MCFHIDNVLSTENILAHWNTNHNKTLSYRGNVGEGMWGKGMWEMGWNVGEGEERKRECEEGWEGEGNVGVEGVDILLARVCTSILLYSSHVRKNLSSKFDEFLAVHSQFDSDPGIDFYAPTCCQSATFGTVSAFYCPLLFTKKNN